jgi:uncharacterized protein (DUF2267 family)
MFSLDRVYGFTVIPQRTAEEGEQAAPQGGLVRIDASLRSMVASSVQKIGASALSTVDFDIDADRANPVRDDVVLVAFGNTQTPRAACERLAARLSATMDNRSRVALLLVIVEHDGDDRRVSLLMLPREGDVLLLNPRQSQATDVVIDVLRDAFAAGTGLRKLARLSGHESRTQFLSAEVLDFQLASAQKNIADFWVERFLQARPRMNTDTGSRELAVALQRAFSVAAPDERDTVLAAMLKAGSGSVRKTSLARFADELPESVRGKFLRGLEPAVQRAVFEVNRGVVKENLSRYIVTTKDGVIISAPSDLVGKTLAVRKSGRSRVVKYEGEVDDERVSRGNRRNKDKGGKRK